MALDSILNVPDSTSLDAEGLRVSIDSFIKSLIVSFESKFLECHYFPDKRRDEERQNICRDYSQVVLELTSRYIPALEATSSRNIPVHLLSFLQAEVRRVGAVLNLGPVILATENGYNYSVSTLNLGELSDLLQDEVIRADEETYLVITLPRIERDSVPLHAVLLGHEIGHVRAWSDGVTANLVRHVPRNLIENVKSPMAEAAITELCVRVADNWYSEFAADVYSALTYGPAALLALAELTGPMIPTTLDTQSHPSTAMRLQLMLTVLADSGFFSGRDDHLMDISAQFWKDATFDHELTLDLHTLLWPSIRSELPRLVAGCAEHVGEERFSFER